MCPSGWGSSASTIRYYEKKGLLPNIRRTKGGIRQFDEETIEWLKLIECLKKTGLSLAQIREFMDMSTQGDATIPQRLTLFQRQRDAIQEEIRQLEEILHLVDYKCWYYETAKDEGTQQLLAQTGERLSALGIGLQVEPEAVRLLAQTGTGVAHCPASNMKLSSGVCRVPDMLRRGVPVGLAVDGAASNDGSNLLEELRVCYLLHRLNWSQNAPTGYDILKIATRGSARLLGRDDIGYLAAGMAADCFLIDLERVELAGAQFDPMSLLGTVGFKGPVDYTIVNGVPVVQRGELVTADEAELTAQANGTVRRYLGRL